MTFNLQVGTNVMNGVRLRPIAFDALVNHRLEQQRDQGMRSRIEDLAMRIAADTMFAQQPQPVTPLLVRLIRSLGCCARYSP